MNKWRRAAALVVALFGATAEAKEFESINTTVRITLPDPWNPTDRGGADADFVLRLGFKIPNETSNGYCTVQYVKGAPIRERTQAYLDMESPSLTKDRDAQVVTQPVLHLVSKKGDNLSAIFYRSMRGNVFSVIFDVRVDVFEKHRGELVAISKSLVAELPINPPMPPKTYKQSKEGGFLFFTHEAVKGKCKTLRRQLAKGLKRFEALHGKLPSPRHAMPQIIVINDFVRRSDVGAALFDADYQADTSSLRMFCKPLGAKPAAHQLYLFHREFHNLLMELAYGNLDPFWLSHGLAKIATSHGITGKKLPAVAEGHFDDLPGKPLTFQAMLDLKFEEPYYTNGFGYAALFVAGPKKYRDTFQAFLAELRETGDWRKAHATHLLALDQAAMQTAAQKFLRKLKAVKAK